MSFCKAIQFYILDCRWVFLPRRYANKEHESFMVCFVFFVKNQVHFCKGNRHNMKDYILFESRVIMWLQRLKCRNIFMYRGCILNCQKHHMCDCQRNLQIGTSLEECVPTFSKWILTSWKLRFYGVPKLWSKGIKLVQSVTSLDH